jgi:hypothetical protein
MKLRNVPNTVAKREAKKSQAKVGDLREAQKHFINILAEDWLDNSVPRREKLVTQLCDEVYLRVKNLAKLAPKSLLKKGKA